MHPVAESGWGTRMPTPLDHECRELLVIAMLAMALADGAADDAEIARICEVYRDLTATNIDAAAVQSLAHRAASQNLCLTCHLSRSCKDLDESARETIIVAAYKVLLADGRIAAGELKALRTIANALDLDEVHYKAVLEDITG